MAKSVAERVRDHKLRHRDDKRLDIAVSPEVKEELERLCKRFRVTQKEMIGRLILQGIVEEFSGAEKARELEAIYGVDHKAALENFREELKRELPGFTVKSKLPEHAGAVKKYDAVRIYFYRKASNSEAD